jgi:hypothetical protein
MIKETEHNYRHNPKVTDNNDKKREKTYNIQSKTNGRKSMQCRSESSKTQRRKAES